MKVYFISGLAADSRVFKHIRLPLGYEMVHLHWIKPLKNESLEQYAVRLAENIVTTEPFALAGLSMGGMIACEIAARYKPAVTILLSSVPTYKHFPAHFRVAYFLRLYKLMPASFLKSASILKRFFTADTAEDKAVLTQVIKDSDPGFIRWAIPAILQWKNEKIPKPLWHIHGSKDKVLPMKYTKPTHIINKGSHILVMSNATEVNNFIATALKSAES